MEGLEHLIEMNHHTDDMPPSPLALLVLILLGNSVKNREVNLETCYLSSHRLQSVERSLT